MKNLFEISVIICNYNHEKWLERTLRSLIRQQYIEQNEYEIIIVDDHSSDHSRKVLKKFKNFNNIKIILNKKNIGLPSSINKAIKSSFGRYIVRVDSDDYVSKNFLFFLKFFLLHNKEYQAVACDYFLVDEKEKILRRVKSSSQEIACGIMFRRECLFDLGLYNTNFKMREGHEMMKRFKKKFKLAFLELPLYIYRLHKKNRTKNKKLVKYYDKIL